MSPPNQDHLQARYASERSKRLHPSGNAQFTDLDHNDRFATDPWRTSPLPPLTTHFPSRGPDSTPISMLIIGAGFGGIQHAVRMVEAGLSPSSIRIIDAAGSWGGTWYWNRYPGLACDIESYMYLPYLEETGYVPRHRYAQGEEIRAYVLEVVKRWGLEECGVFGTQAKSLVWDDEAGEWAVELVRSHSQSRSQPEEEEKEEETLSIRTPFVTIAAGILNRPKLPAIPGLNAYRGATFHSARWAYDITGGSPTDPSLTKLHDKKVAVVGTGATAVQIVPHLARWSKHLLVVQRTPASVDVRGQRETHEPWFRRHVADSKGWQRERMRNFHAHFTLGETPPVNLVDDEWTRAPGLVGLTGLPPGERAIPQTPGDIPAYTSRLIDIDTPRQERIHARVDAEVSDPDTAAALKPWYPSWCKRPAFHDEYLSTFNRANVTLVDTDGAGISHMTGDGFAVRGQHYGADIVVFATGFLAPPAGTPAEKAGLSVRGIHGARMSEEWARHGPTTLHGVLDAKFPNLFLAGPQQAATSGNYRFNLDEYAKHTAYIVAEARKRAAAEGGGKKRVVVAPSMDAAQDWGDRVMGRAAPMGVAVGCTPGYFNLEGELEKVPAEMMGVLARSGLWGSGIEHWVGEIEEWRAQGGMLGMEVR